MLQIYVYGNETRFDRELEVSVHAPRSVHVRHVVRGLRYRVQLSAVNSAGEGLRSDVLYIGQSLVLGSLKSLFEGFCGTAQPMIYL